MWLLTYKELRVGCDRDGLFKGPLSGSFRPKSAKWNGPSISQFVMFLLAIIDELIFGEYHRLRKSVENPRAELMKMREVGALKDLTSCRVPPTEQ